MPRDGRLREFRDGPRLMFKADQVEQLKADMGDGHGMDAVQLGPSDSGAPIGMADPASGSSGGGITLVDSQAGRTVPGKDETAFADIGLSGTIGSAGGMSGSLGGVPSPGRAAPPGLSGSGLSGLNNASSSRSGINVFDLDDGHGHVDASAQTAIGSGIQDQINLEGVGSGSGLLDLTRESDDTSLGAVFDELTPSSRRTAPPTLSDTRAGSSVAMPGLSDTASRRGTQAFSSPSFVVEAPDAMAPAFGAMALAAVLVLCFGGFILASSVMGYVPPILKQIQANSAMYLVGAFAGVIVFGVVGLVIGKATTK